MQTFEAASSQSRGASAAAAATVSVTAGSGSKSTRTRSAASFATLTLSAITMATASPAKRALSWGSTRCGREELVRRVGLAERDIWWSDERPMWDRLEAVGERVGACEHGDDPGQRHGGGGVDGSNARMRMRRAHHDRIGLAGKVEIVAEMALPGQQRAHLPCG